jgi:heme oxygenase-like protein
MTITASSRLRQVLALAFPLISGPAAEFWTHPRLRELYPRYLVSVHTAIRASVPLMVEARAAALQRVSLDPAAGPLAAYLEHHIPEEAHHDDWLLDDLARIGVDRDDVLAHLPSPAVASMVGTQYYYIRHFDPVALLGYIGLLEGYPPTEQLIRMAAERTGYPLEAFRTLRKHAHLDPHHRDDLNHCLDHLPLSADAMKLVTTSALATVERLRCVLDELLAEHPLTLLRSEQGDRVA